MNAPVRSRIGMRIGGRTVDVAVPSGVPVYEVLLKAGVDLKESRLAIIDSGGMPVDPYTTTGDQLVDGAVLHAVIRQSAVRAKVGELAAADPASSRPGASPWWLAVAGVCAIVLAVIAGLEIVSGGSSAGPGTRIALAGVLGATGLVLAVVRGRPGASGGTWPTIVVALAGAGAGAFSFDPGMYGASRLMLVSTLVGASVTTSVRWAAAKRAKDDADLAGVLLMCCGTAAALSVVTLVFRLPNTIVAAALFGAVPIAMRALPTLCVEVPDDQLLDTSIVARTAYAVRTPSAEPLGPVSERAVTRAVTGAERRRDAVAFILSLLAPALAPVVLLTSEPGALTSWMAVVACVFVTLALGLAPRTTRGTVLRWAPRLGAAIVLLELAGIRGLASKDLILAITVCVVCLGLGIALVSLAIGRGWRSVAMSRFADGIEAICTVFALPVALVAGGALTAFWLLTAG